MKLLNGAGARVARVLLEHGAATAAELAELLDLSTTAVRRQLDSLTLSGFVESSADVPFGPRPVRGRGRPARVFRLTQEGREAFHQSYDDIAVGALRYLANTYGEDAVMDFARARVAELERRYTGVKHDPHSLAEALTKDGFAASVEQGPGESLQLCQHHCPIGHVAEEFPQLCEAETEVFSRLLDSHVARLATMARGDAVCTTLVPTDSLRRSAS